MRKGRIYNTNWHKESGKLFWDFWGRDINNDSFYIKVEADSPYFYADDESLQSHRWVENIEKNAAATMKNKLVDKVEVKEPWQRRKLAKDLKESWEADVWFGHRGRFDHGWRSAIKFPDKKVLKPEEIKPADEDLRVDPRICILDIEVMDDTDEFVKPKDAYKEIVAVSLYDSYFDKYACIVVAPDKTIDDLDGYKDIVDDHLSRANRKIEWDGKIAVVKNEYELLSKLDNWLKKTKPDVIAGWNFHDYDFPYIQNRAEKINYDIDLRHYAPFDIMGANDRLTRGRTRNKLMVQAEKILGIGKLKVPQIHAMIENDNYEKLIAYNLVDSITTKEIDEVKGCTDYHLMMCAITGVDMGNTKYPKDMADSYVFHEIHDIVLPTMQYSEKSKYGGGHVVEPVHGLYKYVAIIDFNSEYPRTIITFGLSPDTYTEKKLPGVEYIETPNGNYYSKDKEGLIPELLKGLLNKRIKMKEEAKNAKRNKTDEEYQRKYRKQKALGSFMSTFYGLLGSGGNTFRLANNNISADITAFARKHIMWTRKKVEEIGYTCLYGDTDSIFVKLKGETHEERLEELDEMINKLNDSFVDFAAQYNAEPENVMLGIGLDMIFETWFQPGVKKRYGGLIEWEGVDMRDREPDDRFYEKGLDIGRANVSELTNMVQKKVIMMVLQEEPISNIREYLVEIRNKLYNRKYDKEIGIEAALTKPPGEYKSKQAHVRAYEWVNDNGWKIDTRDPFLWWYTKEDVAGIPLEDDNAIEKLPPIDYDKMWERNVVKKVKKFISPMTSGTVEMFLDGIEQATFEDF